MQYAVPLVQWLRYPELSLDQELHNFDVQCFLVTESALHASAQTATSAQSAIGLDSIRDVGESC